MTVTGRDVTMYAGDDKTLRFSLQDESGEPLDLMDVSLEWVLRDGGQIVLSKTIGNGITVVSESGGVFDVLLAPADTESLAAKQYQHGAVISVEEGQYDTISVGTLTILPMLRSATPAQPMMLRAFGAGLMEAGSEDVEPVTLSEAKLYCKVDGDEDDDLLTALITAARQQAEMYIDRSLVASTAEEHELGYSPDEVPGPIKLAILRTVATHYENREDESLGTVVARLSSDAESLLDPYRVVGL